MNDGTSAGVRVAVATPALLGEGPMWVAKEQALWYCDIPARRLHRFLPGTGELRQWEFATDVGSGAPCVDGSFVLALRDGLWHFDPAADQRRRLVAAPYDTGSKRFNDGKCDAAGRFWVGSMDEPRRPAEAALYCFADGRLEQRQTGITISNGLAWSPDSTTMYWTDTTAHTVWAFDYDLATGAMRRRRVFARFPPKPAAGLDGYGGRPDGAAVDAEGCYWVAMYEGGRVLRFSPGGELLREVRVPALCPTMPCFGGPSLQTVYVTSASIKRSAEELARLPHSGGVFAFDVDVPGLPTACAAALAP
jgi:sugar lactone lactonase YvrE